MSRGCTMEANQVEAAGGERLEAAVAELKSLLGSRATTSTAQREHHSHGESYHSPALPDIVCFPRSTLEVSEIMKISARHQLPVVPFGAGTSVEGQVHAIHGGSTNVMREIKKRPRRRADDGDPAVE